MAHYVLFTSFVGSGDFYTLSNPSDRYDVAGRAMLHSTDGRVFLATNTKPYIDIYVGALASSGGFSTVYLSNAATQGTVAVYGTIRNMNDEGVGVMAHATSAVIRIGEFGEIVATGTNGVGIWLNGYGDTTTARIINDGLIYGNRPIVRTGSEAVEITNNGRIDIISGTAYVDHYGGRDVIINNGIMRGTIELGGGNDTYQGQNGSLAGRVNGGAGNDTMTGGAQAEYFDGGDGDDTLRGNGGNDRLFGGAGNDILDGGAGDDVMEGGTGNDIYYVAAAGDQTTEHEGGGIDTVRSYINWTLGANLERLELLGSAANGTGNALDNTIVGNALANILNGAAGNDYMVGGAGDDIYVVASAGDQTIEAANGGTDTVRSYINWTLAAHVERLELLGSAANGTGNALNNTLVGNSLANVMNGLDGNDYIITGAGNDTLNGGNGNDTLVGGAGADRMSGGAGSDTFLYMAISDSGVGAANRDTILDFVRGQDRIDLSALDANTAAAGNQAFSFIGSAAFSGVAGQLRYSSSGNTTFVDADINGDRVSDFQIAVNGTNFMTGSDFIL
ncbi:calcium-binding protein [Mesorhizobium sp. CAU 1732]|uniref:calcium-binding protein n=1 Tax=Mesorhizobium sp. CAU 1732 TaxID=3140358 RepID=UPI003260D663